MHCSQLVSRVCEEIDLASFALNSKIVTELALEALCALPCPEVLTHDGLGVDTCTCGRLSTHMGLDHMHHVGMAEDCMRMLSQMHMHLTDCCKCHACRCLSHVLLAYSMLCAVKVCMQGVCRSCRQQRSCHLVLLCGVTGTKEVALTRRDLGLLDSNGEQVIELLLSVGLCLLFVLCHNHC